jgi:hypothetical protein
VASPTIDHAIYPSIAQQLRRIATRLVPGRVAVQKQDGKTDIDAARAAAAAVPRHIDSEEIQW